MDDARQYNANTSNLITFQKDNFIFLIIFLEASQTIQHGWKILFTNTIEDWERSKLFEIKLHIIAPFFWDKV